jgi:hypothetical protein
MTRQSPPIVHPEDSRIAVSLPYTANFAAAEGEPLIYKRIILHTLYICSRT